MLLLCYIQNFFGADGFFRMKYINNQQQIVVMKEGAGSISPAVQSLLMQVRKKAIYFEVEPQDLSFGIDLFKPDVREVAAKNIKLQQTL